jgi:hypothetical protein
MKRERVIRNSSSPPVLGGVAPALPSWFEEGWPPLWADGVVPDGVVQVFKTRIERIRRIETDQKQLLSDPSYPFDPSNPHSKKGRVVPNRNPAHQFPRAYHSQVY